jgi:dicarboxylate transporter 10
MQTLRSAASSIQPSPIAVARSAIAESGIRSLYTGLTASLLRQMTYSLVRLGSYEEIKRRLSKGNPPSPVHLLVAASVAGGLGGVAGNPSGESANLQFVQQLTHAPRSI